MSNGLGIAKSAIKILEEKHIPKQDSPQSFIPDEQYKSIFNILEVWDSSREDQDIQEKTKIIYDFLGENPKDRLISIITEIGATPMGELKVDRIYKYVQLKNQANKLLNQYENIQRELNGIRTR